VIDITPSIQNALRRGDLSRWPALAADLKSYASAHDLTFEWDGPGEDWARMLNDRDPVALVWVKIPFAFLNPRQVQLNRLLQNHQVEVVELPDFEEPVIRVDITQLEGLIDPSRWPDVISPARMSAGDLWWATV
jgi:hypothetical protein